MPVLPALAALAVTLASADLPAAPEADPFTAGVTIGAGWDSNLTRQPGAGQATAAGAVLWRAAAGFILEPGEDDALLLEATYAGEQYADGLAPTEHRPGGAVAWVRPLGDRLRLRLGAFGEWLGSEDPLRRGLGAGASLSLALDPAPWLVLRAGLSGARTETSDPAWSTHRTRLRGSATFTPWRGAALVAGYAWQTGTDTAYLDATATAIAASGYGAGAGTGGAGATWATSSLTAVSTPASAHVLSLDAEQSLGGGLFLAGGWSWTSGTSVAGGAWSGQALLVEVGWRR